MSIVIEESSVRRRAGYGRSVHLAVFLSGWLYSLSLRVWRQLFFLAFVVSAVTIVHSQSRAKESAATVRIAALSSVHSDQLQLGDFAAITASDPGMANRLRMIAFGYAPSVGAFRELTREKIAMTIEAAGFPSGTVRLESPPQVTIQRDSQSIDPARIRSAVELSTLAGLRAKGAKAELVRLDLPGRIEAATGELEIRASTGARNLSVPFPLTIEIWIEGRIARRFNATAQVEATAPVMVATRAITAKTRLRAGDFVLAETRLQGDLNRYVTEAAPLRGVSTVRGLASGEAITSDTILSDIVIRPGDPVRLAGESAGLQIVVTGEARSSGRVGDRIPVKNLQSGQVVQALIVDEGLVRVRF